MLLQRRETRDNDEQSYIGVQAPHLKNERRRRRMWVDKHLSKKKRKEKGKKGGEGPFDMALVMMPVCSFVAVVLAVVMFVVVARVFFLFVSSTNPKMESPARNSWRDKQRKEKQGGADCAGAPQLPVTVLPLICPSLVEYSGAQAHCFLLSPFPSIPLGSSSCTLARGELVGKIDRFFRSRLPKVLLHKHARMHAQNMLEAYKRIRK